MERKDKVARENPGLEMVSINFDEISEIYLALCLLRFIIICWMLEVFHIGG
jgi:hypothetical protein